jgi:hypothetical protein
VEFTSARVSYIILRGCWCNIVSKVHAPCEKGDDVKDSFCEELGLFLITFLGTI